jgi:beta-galactosidase
MRVANFLAWQAALVRELKRPDQLVVHNFSPGVHADINERAVARVLDVVGANPYHSTQDRFDGHTQTFNGDFYRSLKRDNYWVTEINAQTIGSSSAHQFPPYDGQARLDVYSHLASGADLVAYWHWHSLHSGIETYWKGVLGHDLEPNRFHAEVTATARELSRIGPRLAGLRKTNEVAILYSVDSLNALEIMPITADGHEPDFMPWTRRKSDYVALLHQVHRTFYDLNVEVDFVFPDAADFSGYKLLVVPALYVADHALLLRIADFVKAGGHVLMTFKSGVADENSRVRHIRLPGPLRDAAGVSYQEFSTLERPLALRGDPFAVGADGNQVMYWTDFLETESAQPLAYYDHPFFGRWPAVTRNHYGDGSLTYVGSWPSQALLLRIASDVLQSAGASGVDRHVPSQVRLKSGVNRHSRRVRYYLNYSPNLQVFSCGPRAATNLITEETVKGDRKIELDPWGVAILEDS